MRLTGFIVLVILSLNIFTQAPGTFRYDSRNGAAVNPDAKIHLLNIFINVIYDIHPEENIAAGNTEDFWSPGDPSRLNSNPPTYLTDFLDVRIDSGGEPKGIMTRKYYESSFGRLVLTGDFIIVNVEESEVQSTGHHPSAKKQLINAVIKKINDSGGVQTIYGHNAFENYDQVTIDFLRQGQYKKAKPDGKADIVQFFIRNPNPFLPDLQIGEGHTVYDPNGHGYDKLKFEQSVKPASIYAIMAVGNEDISKNPNSVYIHEFAHLLLGDNGFHTSGGHTYNTNDCSWFMGLQGGYGLMGVDKAGLTSCNGYERWRLGWTSEKYNPDGIPVAALGSKKKMLVNSDISKEDGSVSFILRDFVTTGDAVRIRLPYVDSGAPAQYIWLENHQSDRNDKVDYLSYSCFSKERSESVPGIHAYMQIGKDVLQSDDLDEIYPKHQADNLRMISAEGFFDYAADSSTFLNCGNKNTIGYIHKRLSPNPFCGYSDMEDKFFETTDTLLWQKHQSTHGIIAENKSFRMDLPNLGDQYDVFKHTAKLSLGTNPAATPMVTFNNFRTKRNRWEKVVDNRTIYLSGLGVQLTDLKNGTFRVDIRWDDYQVKNNVRWTGNIVLKEQLELKPDKTILLDQNQTPVKNIRDESTGFFAPATEFKTETGSVIHLGKKSRLVIDNKSMLKIGSGSKLVLEEGAEVIVRNGSSLIFEKGADIDIRGEITMEVDLLSRFINDVGVNIKNDKEN